MCSMNRVGSTALHPKFISKFFAIIGLSVMALGASANALGPYLDLSYNKARSEQTRGKLQEDLNRAGFQTTVISADNENNILRPTLGYQITARSAVEVSFLHLDEALTRVTSSSPSSALNKAIDYYAPASAEGVTLAYRASQYLDEHLKASIDVGVYHWKSEREFNLGTRSISHEGTDLIVGARLDYTIIQGLDVGVQFSHIELEQRVRMLGVGLRYWLK